MYTPKLRNKKIVIAGGTGFIGQALAAHFGRDNTVIILSRHSAHRQPGPDPSRPLRPWQRNQLHNRRHRLLRPEDGYRITYWCWDGRSVAPHWATAIDGADLVINLAGRTVDCRYTAANRLEILDSRLDATRAIGEAIRQAAHPPALWINAASATIYRHAEDRPQDEYNGEYADDFSAQVCKAWEKAFFEEATPLTRKAALRIAIVLGDDGALLPYLRLARLGLGGPQGSGSQMFSWIHAEDLCRAIGWIAEHPTLSGVFNLSAPHPETNERFMGHIRKATGHTRGLRLPAWLLEAGAAFIGTETELLLKSRWVLPTRLLDSGFRFAHPDLGEAINTIVRQMSAPQTNPGAYLHN